MAARAKQTAEASPLPRSFALRQNQPNPFRGTTAIHFDLPVGQVVRLEIFDAQGRRVRTLANRYYPAGSHVVSWDQRDDNGTAVRPGLCFYRIETQVFRDRKKMVILP
ncbi:MAG TPA: FlgD immunoglobulin-like domain containing protein [Candidatus Eisenbacteria bacterium]|nr:FlgD immunoglobulin-like domain containing protein [Candidatus Eisenbacteria bacterium]